MGQTIAEKILSAHSGAEARAGDLVVAEIDYLMAGDAKGPKALDIFIDRVLKRIAAKTKISFDDELIGYLHVPICWTVFWLGVLHALSISTMDDPWQMVLPQVAN